MPLAGTPTRVSRSRLSGGMSLLVALLLTLLQAGTPLVHVLLHAGAPATHAQATAHSVSRAKPASVRAIRAIGAEERPCPLCAADELSAIPVLHRTGTALQAVPASPHTVTSLERSAQPLEVFCRPPPTA